MADAILHEPRLFATDVDGTLFNSAHKLTPAAEAAIVAAREAGVRVVIATGKGPGPWSDDLLPRLRAMPGPGAPAILMQGLLVLAEDGTVMRRQLLDRDLACELLLLGDRMRQEGVDVNVFGYGADRILCPAIDRHAELLRSYGEAPPTAPPPCSSAAEHARKTSFVLFKVVFITDGTSGAATASVRTRAEQVAAGRARVVQSIAEAVEVLPVGVSKGSALAALAETDLVPPVPPSHIVAAGDGENDIEMLQLAGVGCAMANAVDKVKAVADRVLRGTNDEDGVVEALAIAQAGVW